MAELDYGLRRTPQWRYREARVEIKAGSPRKAFWLLFPLAVASRLQDKEVMGLIGQISAAARVGSRLQDEVEKAIALSDRNEQRLLGELHAHRLRYTARDGVALGAVVFPPAGTARRRAALVLMAPGDSASDYDSLAVALRRAGLAVMLMDVRGSGWSVDAGCPLPDAWRGREERLNTLVARDVRTALNALAKDLPIDTTRYLVAGVGASASIAVQAATLDRRVAALLLVSPNAPPVEHGPMRARLAEIRLPVFFQIAPDDRENFALTDDLFHACNERKSRIAEARAMGHGPLQYHQDPAVALRLTRWLKETMPGPVRPAPRPPTPRRE
jgi:predicted alpha/beta hydrolase